MSGNHSEKNKINKDMPRIMKGPRKGCFKKKKSVKSLERVRDSRLYKGDKKQNIVDNDNSCVDGRENTKVLFNQLWCNTCKIPLNLNLANDKVQKGFGHIYTVKCCKCSTLKTVCTDSTFGNKEQFLVGNAKAAMGLIDSGIGETQINKFLSAMNVAPVSSMLVKRHERMIGGAIETLAMDSCSKNLNEEKYLTKQFNDAVEDEYDTLQ